MAEDEKRAADTLEEIRDLLIEMRDDERARAEETRQQIEESRRIQEDLVKRQKKVQLVALVVVFPILLWLFWTILSSLRGG